MSEKKHFDLELLYQKTNGGLLFFEQEFSGIKTKKTAKGFSFDSGSSNVTIGANDIYLFTNFKENDKGVNCIDYVKNRDCCDFITACNTLFAQFQLDSTSVAKRMFLPTKIWTDTTEKKLGDYEIKYFPKTKNTAIFAPFLTQNTCKDYDFHEIESIETVKQISGTEKLSVLSVTATPDYPIFGYKAENFTKIYEPKAVKNKDGFSSKHHFVGTKPPRHIYGYNRLQQLAKKFNTDDFDEFSIVDESDDAPEQLEYVFIATGGSDGLNIASLGYDVIWFNSETEIISEFELNLLLKVAKNVVYVPDLDKTGVEMAIKMGLMSKKHLKIKMLFPPKELIEKNKKDISDWIRGFSKETSIETVKYNFNELLGQAKEFEFWDYNPKKITYSVNNIRLINFLHYNGFYIYDIPQFDNKSKRAISEKIFLKIEDNIITKTEPSDVKLFVINWLQKMLVPLKIQEMFSKSIFFGDNQSIKLLPRTILKIDKSTPSSQMYFYENTIINVTADNIEKITYKKTIPKFGKKI